jgi:hypothetical protein
MTQLFANTVEEYCVHLSTMPEILYEVVTNRMAF